MTPPNDAREASPEDLDEGEDVRMSLLEHLEELRFRIMWVAGATIAAAIGCYQVMPILMDFLLAPIQAFEEAGIHVIGTGVAEAFFTKLKIALVAGIFAASPVTLYHIWRFVAPGLYTHEKRFAIPFIIFGTAFFISGAAFCYTFVFPTAYGFFIEQYGTVSIEPFLRISEYLTFSTRLLLAFGVVFELPVFTFFFARMGMVTHTQMISWWRYAILVIFIAAAVLTPGPDVASQLLMAGPLLVLYVLSVGVAYLFAKERPEPEDDDEEPGTAD